MPEVKRRYGLVCHPRDRHAARPTRQCLLDDQHPTVVLATKPRSIARPSERTARTVTPLDRDGPRGAATLHPGVVERFLPKQLVARWLAIPPDTKSGGAVTRCR
jgi:hypothetical protein